MGAGRSISRHILWLLLLIFAGHTIAGDAPRAPDAGFSASCKDASVEVCLALDSEAEISRLRFSPSHLDASNRIQWDAAARAARFTIPPRSPADSSGQLHIQFPQPLVDVYVSFDVRYPAELLRHKFKRDGGWKIFILGQGKQGCAPYEIVANNPRSIARAAFYYICGATGNSRNVAIQDPLGGNWSQFDYQPGGDTACLRMPAAPGTTVKPCASLEPDTWINFQVHVNTITSVLEVWQTVHGKTLKIIDFQLQGFPMPPAKYEWIKLTPYNTGKDTTEVHPSFHLWYRRVIVATKKIPFPGAE
jgi:hypothetical protein